MKRGPKPQLPSEKKRRGTFQNSRDGGKVEVIEPEAMPIMPDWLTAAGHEVWLDNIGRVAEHSLVSESDSTMFGNWCNLQGAINQAWKEGEVPPAAHLMEARKMAEQFGIFGRKSRLKVAPDAGKKANPFKRNGNRT